MPHSPRLHRPQQRRMKQHKPSQSQERRQAESLRRKEAGDSWYGTTRWRKLRAAQLSRHPVCADCEARELITAATEVDHVVPRRQRPDLAYDMNNLKSLCKPCHSHKTNKQNSLRKRNRGRFDRGGVSES